MITPLYGAILGILFLVLSTRTLRLRRKLGIAVGDSGNIEMLRAMRAHANFAEYTPLTLLMIFFVEQVHGQGLFIHLLASALVVGRCLHAFGISQVNESFRYRVGGMFFTLNTLLACSVYLLFKHF
jgi:uncharacterized protein